MMLPLKHSFRGKLFSVLLWMTLIPLIGCSVLLIVIFKARMTENSHTEAEAYMSTLSASYAELCEKIAKTAATVDADNIISNALSGAPVSSRLVYERLYTATEEIRSYAQTDLYDIDGGWLYSTGRTPAALTLATDWGILYAAERSGGRTVFRNGDAYSVDGRSAAPPAFQAARLIFSHDEKPVGYALVTMSEDDIEGVFAGKFGAQNTLLLLDARWRVTYCSRRSDAETLAASLREKLLGGGVLSSDAYSYIVAKDALTGGFIILQQPQVITESTMRLLYSLSAVVALLCICVCVIVSLKLSKNLFEPIDHIQRAFRELEEGNTDVRVDMKRNDELGLLALSFNHMVERLRDYMERMVRGQRELDEAQIRMMQSQLNPHFLCNTLDTMKWMGKMHNVPEIAEMSTDLADILRTSISDDEFVDLQTEMNLLKRYIDIQRIRFPGKFVYVENVSENYADCIVPKLILQPLVENAVLHGLNDRESGVISISAAEIGEGKLRITVSDDGSGISQEMLDKLHDEDLEHPEGHLGLYNVNMILKKYYGSEYGLMFENIPGSGASVSAELPIRRKDKPC